MNHIKLFENYNKTNENFYEWFSGSKVVDMNGEPLVVYHGTSNTFKVFDKTKIGDNYFDSTETGFFFTQKEQQAINYARLHSVASNKSNIHTDTTSKGFVISAYLRIKKPLIRKVNSDYISPAEFFDINKSNLFFNGDIISNNSDTHDGIIIEGTKKDNLYVVLNSNQIKSVDNDGSYNIDDDNIFS